MNRLHLYVLFFLLMETLVPFKVIGQDIRFKHLTINDGLSQNLIFSMVQDDDGYMWFGTKDGLNKYDGYTFKVFQYELNNPNSISSNYITSLFKDSNGKIWIGTGNGQLNIYQKSTQNFQRIKLPLATSEGKNTDEITTITQDHSGTIWVGTKVNGLFKVPYINNAYATKNIKQFYRETNKTNQLASNYIKKLYVDASNILWISTNEGLSRMDIEYGIVSSHYINVKDKKAPGIEKDYSISAITTAGKGKLWLGTHSGLVRLNTQNYSYEFFPHHLSVFRFGWGEINEIVANKKGQLWLSTSAELMRFDTLTSTYESIKNDPLNPESISYNCITSLAIDRTQIVWVGTSGMGINYYDPKSNRFGTVKRTTVLNSRITGFSIRAVLEENNRYVWISTESLYRWDRKTGELKSYETSSNKLNDFGNSGCYSMIKSKDNLLWFGTSEGLYKYDPKTEKSIHFFYDLANPNRTPNKSITTVFESNDGNLWVVSGNYLSLVTNREKGIFKHYKFNNLSEKNSNLRTVICEDYLGRLWIGTKNGLVVFNPKKKTFHTYRTNEGNSTSLSNNQVNVICVDPNHPTKYLWIGTSGGLNKLDITKGTFSLYTKKEGLPNNVIYGILPDNQNNLWLSTNKGLSRFNPTTNKFRNYDVEDGLQSNEFNTGAFYKSSKGELFFGGIDGLNYFFPDQIIDNPYEPQLGITEIKIYSEGTTEIRQFPQRSNEIIELHPKDNIIQIEFAAMDFSASGKNRYAYKLENFNENWIDTDHSRTATFTNLPPGDYILKVKGSNNDGIWNEKGIAIPIKVFPHWTATWWAYSLYAFLLLLLLYWFRKYEMKRIQLKNDLEIEHKEIDTLKVLDQLKTRFFTNISHEFRTPLTLIRGNTEKLMNELPSNSIRNDVQVIDENAKTLLKLINELLDISKLEAGKMPLKSTQQDIVMYLKNLFYSVESIATLKNISLSFISEKDTIQVLFDPEKMEKIVMNIISNALKFTKENGEITLTVRTIEDQLSICVCDSGSGISETDLPNIFNRFYQSDNSDTRMYEGTGIGLALAKELIELHQGTICVYRNQELTGQEGTTFIIEIPIGIISPETPISESVLTTADSLYQITNFPNPSFQSITQSYEIPIFESNSKLILLVEDNLSIRDFIKSQLEANYKIIEANNGSEGIELSKNFIPNIIISDVMMPIMDGIAMVHELRNDEKTSHIPIIMLSGKASLADKITGLETGIDAYLTKPFSVKELQLTVNNLIQKTDKLRKKYKNQFITTSDEVPLASVDQLFLEKVIQHIKNNMENPNLSVDDLANQICLSSSQLTRKLQALLHQSPGQLIRNIRLQKAAELIKGNAGNIAEICFQTGFNDQAYFSKAFKKQFGSSPSSYKKEQSGNYS